MGVVTVSSSTTRTLGGLNTNFSCNRLKRPLIIAFEGDEQNDSSSLDVDYNEAAAMLENIYKLIPTFDADNVECIDGKIQRVSLGRKKIVDDCEEKDVNDDMLFIDKLIVFLILHFILYNNNYFLFYIIVV
ncbi:hypothetical protein LR48_Vigan02g090800 [Vigna angularis]|uniref:Uncharacterized protein n=1 Tax=Phaseolus angularis TaxID=3914 RepID=A0A0L9TVZ0_PHAAN|nr:hypothetical protein LR48_Vigan02g090800 [Vigna angularis]